MRGKVGDVDWAVNKDELNGGEWEIGVPVGGTWNDGGGFKYDEMVDEVN